MCGENFFFQKEGIKPSGSPPRVRGKQVNKIGRYINVRITPACAGKTPSRAFLDCLLKDHPRVCGENLPQRQSAIEPIGSPPRVRGKPPPRLYGLRPVRITPACAGKTKRYRVCKGGRGDHPRVCGENDDIRDAVMTLVGSPPRVRGKREVLLRKAVVRGITPACAGKTVEVINADFLCEDHPRVCGENRRGTQSCLWS